MTPFSEVCYNARLAGPATVMHVGQVAQLVEQRIENPRVGSSILPLATKIVQGLGRKVRPFFIACVSRPLATIPALNHIN